MRPVAIVGVGHSRFGRRPEVNLPELAFEAIKPALGDAGVAPKDIGFVAVGSAGGWHEETLPAVTINEYAGLSPVGTTRVEAACATGSAAVRLAYLTVASGEADIALALGVEKMSEVDTLTAVELMGRAGSYLWEFENYGMTFAGYYALYATAHMARFGTTPEDLARVAVKAHRYGAMNPNAHFQKEITVEKALASPVIAHPLKLYDCCPLSDGAAAVVLAADHVAKQLNDSPVWIRSFGVASDTANLSKRDDYVGLKASRLAAAQAYARAHVSPQEFDVATVHDCFTIAEILAYEDLGFAAQGQGTQLVRDGQTEVGGKMPVNLDGGLKAKGHPIGATGTSMFVEIAKQLRQDAGSHQAPIRHGLGLVHNVGGTGHYAYVSVLAS
jgi:acetyl-CoA C-acetyltransferase